jgi:RNA polymerase sigma factor (sigma-70 family)
VKPLMAATATGAPDEQLVAAAREGSDEAFEALFCRYRDRVVGYVRGMVSDHGRAEDIVQEAFMSALRSLRRTDQEIVFRPWIYEIAKNACIDHLRRARRAQEVSIDSDDFSPAEESRISQTATGTDAAVARRGQLDSLRMAFDDLPPSQHQIIVMRELEGLSYDSIGNRMGLTRGAVESLLFRARRRLRDGFDEIDTGARCESMRTAMQTVADGDARARERRRLSSHLQRCKPCRRHAVAMGLDTLVLGLEPGRTRRALDRAAALLPLPGFLRRRIGESAGSLGQASQAGIEQSATLVGKTAAVLVAAALAAGGAGVAQKASGGDLGLGHVPIVGNAGSGGGAGDGGGSGGIGGNGQAGAPGAGPGGAPAGSVPAGPNGPGGGAQGALPGGMGGKLGTGQGGHLVQTLSGAGGTGDTVESVGKVVGISPGNTVDQLSRGDVGGVVNDVGGAVKNAPNTVKDAPQAVKDVTKSLPKTTVPKTDVTLPGGTSVKTGQGGGSGTSVTVPPTQLPGASLPGVNVSPSEVLPQTDLTSGLGL